MISLLVVLRLALVRFEPTFFPEESTSVFNAKAFKKSQADNYSAIARRYDQSFAIIQRPASVKLLDAVGLNPGDEVLDLCCGTGFDTPMIAERVGPSGKVVGTDIAPGMLEVAKERAASRGLTNVSFEVMDAEKLGFRSNTFDAVVCKLGLAALPDSHQGISEVLRVLKPGGRFSTLAMGRPERSQFVTVGSRAIAKYSTKLVTHAEGGPSDFAFGPEGTLEGALKGAGFTNIRSRRFVMMITCETGEDYWKLLTNGAANLYQKLTSLPQNEQESIKKDFIQTVERHMSPEGLRLPYEVVMGYAEKPKSWRGEVQAPPPKTFAEFIEPITSGVPQVKPSEAKDLVGDAGVLVVDVRPSRKFNTGTLPGAQSAPRGLLESAIGPLVEGAEPRAILVVGDDGQDGVLACKTLLDMGYENVKNLEGGIRAWADAQGEITV